MLIGNIIYTYKFKLVFQSEIKFMIFKAQIMTHYKSFFRNICHNVY